MALHIKEAQSALLASWFNYGVLLLKITGLLSRKIRRDSRFCRIVYLFVELLLVLPLASPLRIGEIWLTHGFGAAPPEVRIGRFGTTVGAIGLSEVRTGRACARKPVPKRRMNMIENKYFMKIIL
jgi:hypothetical protein